MTNETEFKDKIEEIIGIDDFKGTKREEIELTIQLLLKQCYLNEIKVIK